MNKKIWITLIVIGILIGLGIYLFLNNSNKNNNQNNLNQESSSINNEDTNSSNELGYTSQRTVSTNNINENTEVTPPQKNNNLEKEISSFSTKIYTKDSERQNNVKITCSTLNNTDLAPGDTFSFTNTVGKATSSKGYQEADIFTNGQKTKGLGGGNCQVSTTLYNAVLKVNGLNVTERHEHSNDVPYIQNGKDAAVSYGSYDFKFINNLDYTIRIKAAATDDNITIKLLQVE